MNKKVKEFLDKSANYEVIEYIGNLQQENKQLQKELEEYKNPIKYFKYANKNVTEENKHLKEQLLVTQTNEETFRLEMKDITKILGLDENTLFDDVKVYARSLKDNWNKLKEYIEKDYDFYDKLIAPEYGCAVGALRRIKDKMQEIEERNNQ